jgi:uncharacterized protein (DUF1778 family)
MREAKRALQAAAATQHSVSEFVLDSALTRASEVLADRRTFSLSAAQWKAFVAALEAQTRRLPSLKRLLRQPALFDTGQ